jgi:hypothetical protein
MHALYSGCFFAIFTFYMKTINTSIIFRIVVVFMTGLLLLTHVVQARQGLLPGGSGERFEAHNILESASRLVMEDMPGPDDIPSIVEAPLLIPALTGILPSVDRAPSASAVCLAKTVGSAQLVTRREYCSGAQLSMYFIPPLPFSSVLRL